MKPYINGCIVIAALSATALLMYSLRNTGGVLSRSVLITLCMGLVVFAIRKEIKRGTR